MKNTKGESPMTHVELIKATINKLIHADKTPVPNCSEDCEGYFTWNRCELCGAPQGSTKHPAAILNNNDLQGAPERLEICDCCLLYIAHSFA